MNTKQTFAALALAFTMVAGSAQAVTVEEMREAMEDYRAEMPELTYQSEAIDCKVAEKFAVEGALWAIDAIYDVRKDPDVMALTANMKAVGELAVDFDFHRYIKQFTTKDPDKGYEEILDTYKGFYLQGAWAGAAQKMRVGKFTLKEKRDYAKEVGKVVGGNCESYKEEDTLNKAVALYKVSAGEF